MMASGSDQLSYCAASGLGGLNCCLGLVNGCVIWPLVNDDEQIAFFYQGSIHEGDLIEIA
jgi:hypothetical protein